MLSTIDATQWNALLADPLDLLGVLPSLEAVKQVVAERLVEVESESSSHLRSNAVRVSVSRIQVARVSQVKLSDGVLGPRSASTCSTRPGWSQRWAHGGGGRAAQYEGQ